MKKLLSVILTLIVTFTMICGCTPQSETVSSSQASSSGETNATPMLKDADSAFKLGDTLSGENNRLTNLTFVTDSFKIYDKIELKVDIKDLDSSLNVYDEKDVDLSISLISLNGTNITLPGFYYEEYTFSDEGQNMGRAEPKADFRFRISLTEVSSWDFVITLKIKGEIVDTVSGYINSEDNKEDHGYLSVEPKRKQNFVFTDGTGFTAIGHNIVGAWNDTATQSMRSAKMIEWMEYSAEYGANFTRIWLLQWLLSIQKGNLAPNDLSGGMSDAAQFDQIFDTWNEIGMYGQVCLFSFNQFRNETGPAAERLWSGFPYNKDTPYGYLEKPIDFFTDERAIEDTKTYFRYMVARYAYSTNLFSWEFFNEIDLAEGYDENLGDVVEWHKKMSDYIRSIDPYGHMITTSTAVRDEVINTHSMFDYASIHYYNYNSIGDIADFQKQFWQLYSRPVMMGECGIISAQVDEDLITFHQQNWAGVMGGGSGTAASWYWEAIDEAGGYWDYQVVSEMADHIPWNSDSMFMVATENASPSNEKVQVLGYRGNDFAYLWLYDTEFTQLTKTAKDIENLEFSVKLSDGKYHVRWINTWTGVSISQTEEYAKDGELKLVAPTWSKDVAVAITVD